MGFLRFGIEHGYESLWPSFEWVFGVPSFGLSDYALAWGRKLRLQLRRLDLDHSILGLGQYNAGRGLSDHVGQLAEIC